MNLRVLLAKIKSLIYGFNIKSFIILICVLIGLNYTLVYLIPRPVEFSYARPTCIGRIEILPSIKQIVANDSFNIRLSKNIHMLGFPIVSRQTCFTPSESPARGKVAVKVSPFGYPLLRKNYKVYVGKAPEANISTLSKPLPATKPISIELNKTDKLFSYELEVAKKTTECEALESKIECDITKLKLKQGKSYDFKLSRDFFGEDKTGIEEGELKTLKAVKVEKSSIKNQQTIYKKPKKATLIFDKKINSAKVKLINLAKNPVEVPVKTRTDGNQLFVNYKDDLKRQTNFKLKVYEVEATDGSTLVDPYVKRFSTSGGPTVKNISIGNSQVEQSETIYLTFDQAVSKNQDISRFVTVSGGSAQVRKISETQISVALENLPLCRQFKITIAPKLTSKYGVVAKSGWSHTSRTKCYRTASIGSSRQGRPITAYYFGNSGSTTLFIGALHGNETSSTSLLRSLINHLDTNPRLVDGRRIVIVPAINPDGVALGTRNNANNVNLNRNFPTENWQKDINDTNGYVKNGGGKKPLSEPESKALYNLSLSLRPKLMLSYHAVGNVVIGDAGGYSAPLASKYAYAVGYRNATGQGSNVFDYSITGAYEEWTIRKAGIPSLVIELGSYTYADFSQHRSAIEAMLQ